MDWGTAMKKTTVFLTLILIVGLLISCDSSPTGTGKSAAYYASGNLSSFTLRSLEGTGAKETSSNTDVPDIFAVKGSDLVTLSEEDTILAIRTCLDGKTIVIDSPTLAQLDAFWVKIQTLLENEKYEFLKAEHELSPYTIYNIIANYGQDEGDDEEYTNSVNEHVYEAIGLRHGDLYYVHDIDEIVNSTSGHKYKGTGNTKSKETSYSEDGPVSSGSTTETDVLSSLDTDWDEITNQTIKLFSEWLKKDLSSARSNADAAFSLSGAGSRDAHGDFSNLQKAQTITFSYTVSFSYKPDDHYNGSLNGKKEVVQTFVDVWTACDIANQTEYYLVRTSVVFNNQQLGGIHGFSYSSQSGSEGPYFDSAALSMSLPGGILRGTDCSPQNESGSTNFTTGSSFSISGSVGGTAAGPTGGISAGLSVNESTSRSIPDTSIVFTPTTNGSQGGDKSAWSISTPAISLRKDDNYFWNLKWLCDGAKSIQKNAATFDFYSLYTRPSSYDKTNKNAMFEINLTTQLGVTSIWLKGAYPQPYPTTENYFLSKWVRHHLPFTRPNNLSGEYIMGFSAPSGSTQDEISLMNTILKEYFPEWDTNVTYYAFGDNSNDASRDPVLDSVAGNYFTTIKQKMTTNQNVIKNRGISGEYTFYIQRVYDGYQVKSFTMTF